MKASLPISLLLFAASGLFAQITVTNATFPVAGDVLHMAIDNSPTVSNWFTPPGGNQTWDFTTLQADETQNITYNPASGGTVSAQVPGAELFIPLPFNAENYYNVTSTRFELQAYWGILPYDLVSNNLFNYSPLLPERHAPLNFFDIYQNSTGLLELFVPSDFPPLLMLNLAAVTNNAQIDSMRYRVVISEIEVVDAWGSASIPGGTYDVLRDKRTRYTETRIDAKIPPFYWVDITDQAIQAGFQGLGADTMVSHYFFNDVVKEPIAVLTLNNAQNALTKAVFRNNATSCPTGNVLFVKANATGANNGTSWANAFTDLQSALASTCPGITEIWVAAGTYKPTTGTDRTVSFVMKNGVAIYGGFNGTETMLSQRNWTINITTLSGDIGAVGVNTDNSRHVINNNFTSGSPLTGSAVLDGFTVTGAYSENVLVGGGMRNNFASPTVTHCIFTGNAMTTAGVGGGGGGGMTNTNSSPTVTNCTFSNNVVTGAYGGGMLNETAYPIVTDCIFTGNTVTSGGGGGMYNHSSNPIVRSCAFKGNSAGFGGGIGFFQSTTASVTNCVFSGNSVGANGGGGAFIQQSSCTLVNCSFSGNLATANGGAVRLWSAGNAPIFINCILWGNSGPEVVTDAGSSSTFNNCIVQGGCPASATCNSLLNTDPLFVNQPPVGLGTTGDLHLQPCSPAINTGTATGAPTTDYDNDARPFGAGFDMGFDEYIGGPCCTFTLPPNDTATVACPALATQPVPPGVTNSCGNAVVPTGPVITNSPNPLTCEGTKTYTWTYTYNNIVLEWAFTYTIEREDFDIIAPNGSATVACLAQATLPFKPIVPDNCGQLLNPTGPVITLSPDPLTCEGTKTYTWTYTDCEGNSHDWSFTYTIERIDFAVPANGAATIACPSAITTPVPPVVTSNCGDAITPTGPDMSATPTCEGTKTYTWTYTDCEGNTHDWVFTYTIERNDFAVPANGAATVACASAITMPVPPTVLSDCGETIAPIGPVVGSSPACEGTKTYTWTYTDCEGNAHDWVFTYTIERSDFAVPANGAATVACASVITTPVPPTVLSDCGETIAPIGPVVGSSPACEGTKTYTWTYTDCEGNAHDWVFTYTIERSDFAVPANGAATVACPALATPPSPPVVLSNCGETLAPTGPAIANSPNPLVCAGTRTYTYTYTDCEGNSHPWSFVYNIVPLLFTMPANGAATVACPALATQPIPPVVSDNCGNAATPTGPVIVNNPNPITCEGTRTFTWIYTDCAGNARPWSFTYTIERQPFTVPANGAATVACTAQADVQPTPPVVTSNCGELLTPVVTSSQKLGCEGNRNWYFTYTDCEGNTATWIFTYTVEYTDFSVPPSVVYNVACPLNAQLPVPPTVFDNCGKLLNPTGPVISGEQNAQGCEASRSYVWTYKDCEGNTQTWGVTYHFLYGDDFFVPLDEENFVGCLSYAAPPVPQTLYDACLQEIAVSGPEITEIPGETPCSGSLIYTFVYTDCSGHSHPWTFTVHAGDYEPPIGNCPSGTENNVDVTDLACVQDVPCPDDFDFSQKIKEMLAAGGFFDLCSGTDLVVELDSWSELWDCSDEDGDGQFSFGRRFYFSIADQCGNEMPELCSVTYSGGCQPITMLPQESWGMNGESNEVSLAYLQHLLDTYGPLTIGGENSLTLTQAQCVASLLPGEGGTGPLGDCEQFNCSGGCNATATDGMKNDLAANAIATMLNLYHSMDANGADLHGMMGLGLGCLTLDPSLLACGGSGGLGSSVDSGCQLHVFDHNGIEHTYPYTIGGLMELVNAYLGSDLDFTDAQSGVFGTALNTALDALTGQYSGLEFLADCDPNPGVQGNDLEVSKAWPTSRTNLYHTAELSLAPNPANRDVSVGLTRMAEAEEVSLAVYTAFGQLVLRKDFGQVTSLHERIDLTGLSNGMYFVSVKAGGELYEQKLVISRD